MTLFKKRLYSSVECVQRESISTGSKSPGSDNSENLNEGDSELYQVASEFKMQLAVIG